MGCAVTTPQADITGSSLVMDVQASSRSGAGHRMFFSVQVLIVVLSVYG